MTATSKQTTAKQTTTKQTTTGEADLDPRHPLVRLGKFFDNGEFTPISPVDDRGVIAAVGLANGSNPISIIVPCHRVIGADGSLTGFGGGLDIKRRLLAHEGLLLGLV